jgi:hypothetical protein
MKMFVSENWYKLMIGSSLLMASFGFMVHSVSPAMADDNNQKFNVNSNYRLVPTNADGSINVKLAPNAIMDVNLTQIRGASVARANLSSGSAGLIVGTCSKTYECD